MYERIPVKRGRFHIDDKGRTQFGASPTRRVRGMATSPGRVAKNLVDSRDRYRTLPMVTGAYPLDNSGLMGQNPASSNNKLVSSFANLPTLMSQVHRGDHVANRGGRYAVYGSNGLISMDAANNYPYDDDDEYEDENEAVVPTVFDDFHNSHVDALLRNAQARTRFENRLDVISNSPPPSKRRRSPRRPPRYSPETQQNESTSPRRRKSRTVKRSNSSAPNTVASTPATPSEPTITSSLIRRNSTTTTAAPIVAAPTTPSIVHETTTTSSEVVAPPAPSPPTPPAPVVPASTPPPPPQTGEVSTAPPAPPLTADGHVDFKALEELFLGEERSVSDKRQLAVAQVANRTIRRMVHRLFVEEAESYVPPERPDATTLAAEQKKFKTETLPKLVKNIGEVVLNKLIEDVRSAIVLHVDEEVEAVHEDDDAGSDDYTSLPPIGPDGSSTQHVVQLALSTVTGDVYDIIIARALKPVITDAVNKLIQQYGAGVDEETARDAINAILDHLILRSLFEELIAGGIKTAVKRTSDKLASTATSPIEIQHLNALAEDAVKQSLGTTSDQE
jgi:hypothetical protein